LVCYLPDLRREISLWERGNELLPFKDKEESLSFLLVSQAAALGYLVDVETTRLGDGSS
jgi:hypothetical protein